MARNRVPNAPLLQGTGLEERRERLAGTLTAILEGGKDRR